MNLLKGLGGALQFISTIDEQPEFRKDALNTVVKKTTIDTVCACDTGKWETGIQIRDENWIIVEQYKSRASAIKGHKKWVSKVKKGKKKFVDIDMWGLNE